jgi:peptide/nickel transport system substrate-binding protein
MKAIRNFTRTDWALAIVTLLLVASVGGNIFLGIQTGLLQVAPPEENILVFGTTAGPEDIDPANCYDTGGSDVLTQVCESLLKINLSDPNKGIIPSLATELPTINDMNMTVKLRQGVTFHDGTKFNATAVKWNFDRLMHFINYSGNDWLPAPFNKSLKDVPTSAFKSLITGPGGIPLFNRTWIIDEYTLNITLNYETGFLFPLLAYHGLSFVSPESTPANDYVVSTEFESLIGTGPFKYQYYIGDLEVRLVANEDYWRGAPKLDGVVFVLYTSGTVMNDALKTGDIHATNGIQTSKITELQNDPGVTLVGGEGSLNTQHLYMHGSEINKTWREAISYAIDYDYLIDVELEGFGQRLRSPIPQGVLYSNYSFDAAIFNITRARLVLQSMGYGVGQDVSSANDAWWEAQFFREWNITTNDDIDQRVNVINAISDQLDLIGIDADAIPVTFETYVDWLTTPSLHDNLRMHLIGWSADFIDPDNYVEWHCHSDSALNVNYTNAEMDDWIEEEQAETDPVARGQIFDDIQELYLEEDYVSAPLYTGIDYDGHLNNVKGWVYNNIGRVDLYPVYFA